MLLIICLFKFIKLNLEIMIYLIFNKIDDLTEL